MFRASFTQSMVNTAEVVKSFTDPYRSTSLSSLIALIKYYTKSKSKMHNNILHQFYVNIPYNIRLYV